MAVLSKDELMNRVKSRIGDDTSDDALAFVEDVSDTLEAMGDNTAAEEWDNERNKMQTTIDDLQTKHEELRKKYLERFFSGGTKTIDPADVLEPEEPPKPTNIDDLFIKD